MQPKSMNNQPEIVCRLTDKLAKTGLYASMHRFGGDMCKRGTRRQTKNLVLAQFLWYAEMR